jgi:hypothetical protein
VCEETFLERLREEKVSTIAVTRCVSTGKTYAPDDVLYECCDDCACSVRVPAAQHLLGQLGGGRECGEKGREFRGVEMGG